jgi:predicted secreted Zn-dependent protease
MKQSFFHLLLLFVIPSATAQTDTDDYLTWKAGKPLTWADYKARPDVNSDAAATTTTVLSIEYNISNNDFGYKITSRFSKTRSWGRHKTDYILSHEQGHFDIAEIFARKLHKQMSEYKFNKRTYQKDLKKIYDEVSDEKTEMQDDYDRETRHSINKEKQAEWLKKIEKLLKEYENYSNY